MRVQLRSTVRWWWFWGLGLSCVVSGGCAARQEATTVALEGLRSRVTELEASRQRDGERIEALMTRLVALEPPVEAASRRRPALPVVRVRPEQEPTKSRRLPGSVSEEAPAEEEPDLVDLSEASADDDGGDRPLLKLYESPTGGTIAFSGIESGGGGGGEVVRRPSRPRIDLGAVDERLPVVPMADMPGAPPLEASPASLQLEPEQTPGSSVEEIIASARQQVSSGNCAAVMDELAQVVARSAEHPLAPAAMLLRARCHRRQGASLRAVGELERMIRRYPHSGRVAEGLLEMAEIYTALGDLERARQIFGQVMRRYPRSQAASRATARVQSLGRGGRAREER